LVIWSADAAEGGAFSAGADLQAMLPLFMSGGVKAIEPEVARLQQAFQAMKYANVPVVAAVAGLALGGGCELMLHAARRVALIESYIGLVEVGVGLIPAGGGLKEAAVRSAEQARGNDLLQFLKNNFMNPATAAVSKSALEARQMGYLKSDDVIVFNPYELLHVAKVEARAMFDAGYRPPLAETGAGGRALCDWDDHDAARQHARRRLHFGPRLQAGPDDRHRGFGW
jgi:3-hydroxyacyl-CoA dehydrogenase